MWVRHVPEPHPIPDAPAPGWFAWIGERWAGPLTLHALTDQRGFEPDTWVHREGEEAVKPAHQESSLVEALRRRYSGASPATTPLATECPNCRIPLARMPYEGVPIDECPACRGCYVTPDQMSRVLAREEYDVPDAIKRLAQRSLPAGPGCTLILARRSFQARRWCCWAGLVRYVPASLPPWAPGVACFHEIMWPNWLTRWYVHEGGTATGRRMVPHAPDRAPEAALPPFF